ncbi:P-loop containing nucleoside triphosphate hydrolase protein [Mollisia scopiformis]|uniref:p-loop containing nucleoside triphosphate hydrolase protein n=1 Tax=Mollisia scopiformis TaxID=149040 RepID=A0A132B2Q7_MOLSC|nr:P-loop containing nucleoside triphosphate hydrolase protein [Mollisia scopiformis]KUJ06533.1 P-loop containing nucleoside triphosphate hydrolase protein [Mollisia scopiformis]
MASRAEAGRDAFTFIDRTVDIDQDGEPGPPHVFPKFGDLTSAKLPQPIVQLLEDLREKYPDHVVTYADTYSLNLLAFAAAGLATATLDIETDSIFRVRVWQQPIRRGAIGQLAEGRGFAKYRYRWGDEDFILYCITVSIFSMQFVLKEYGPGEGQLSHSAATDTLLAQVGLWSHRTLKGIYVYDLFWRLDLALYEQVQKATWDKVILDPGMKKDLTSVSGRFFDSKAVYDDLGVPWKRGLIFYGPAGNGKTISIKALMHTLAERKDSIPTLYVKSAPRTLDIRNIFALARQMTPCLLVLEDIDTIVTAQTRSYFFNEVDGLENNDGILMVASTNHIDELDPGLSKRPSRFDRKYLFPAPSKAERVQYVQYWRQKLKKKPEVVFPESLVEPIADITHDFSFAYIQEAFVSSLLDIAHHHDDEGEDEEAVDEAGGGDEDLDKYELWRVLKEQVKILRDEMDAEALRVDPDFTTFAAHTAPPASHNYVEDSGYPSTNPEDSNLLHHTYSESSHGSAIHQPLAIRGIHPGDGFSALQPPFSGPACPTFGDSRDQLRGMTWFEIGHK